MCRYALSTNYLQWKENDQSKRLVVYIDGRPKEIGNIVGFINSTCSRSTNKQPNCIFEACEGNRVFVCAIKSISLGENLLIDYNLNRINTKKVNIMGLVSTIYVIFKLITSNYNSNIQNTILLISCFAKSTIPFIMLMFL